MPFFLCSELVCVTQRKVNVQMEACCAALNMLAFSISCFRACIVSKLWLYHVVRPLWKACWVLLASLFSLHGIHHKTGFLCLVICEIFHWFVMSFTGTTFHEICSPALLIMKLLVPFSTPLLSNLATETVPSSRLFALVCMAPKESTGFVSFGHFRLQKRCDVTECWCIIWNNCCFVCWADQWMCE